MKILNFGSMNIDYIYQIPHSILPGETLTSAELDITAGGKGANQSAALAKAGLSIHHAGKIGADGKWMLDKLSNFGVDTSLVEVTDGTSGHAIIILADSGENSIILYKGSNHQIDKLYIDKVFSNFTKGDMLIIQNEISNLDVVIAKAKEKGLSICFNPAPYTSDIENLELNDVNYLILNEIEGSCLADGNTKPDNILSNLSAKYPNTEIVLTLGEDGVLATSNRENYKADIFPVTAVDTTAAGDTFIGYYISSRIVGVDIQSSLESASKASSITVTRKGAMDSIPYDNEL